MRAPAIGKAALVALLVSLPAGVRADFANAVRAYEAGDYETAYAEWLPLAERGDPAAERNIGHLYRMGWAVPQDFEEAAKWYRRAAEKGFARAQANLANMYLRGQGLARDHAMAIEWFRRAGLQGHAVAQYNLGLMYENGLGVEPSDAKAMGWYHLASRTGHRRARDKLALLIAKSTSELGPLIEVPVVETATVADTTTKDEAEERPETANIAVPEPEPAGTAILEPVETTNTVDEEPVGTADIAVQEPEPAAGIAAPEPEGPRRDPVEVILDERGADPDVDVAIEFASVELAAGDPGLGSRELEAVAAAAAPAPAVDADATDEEAESADQGGSGPDPSAPDVAPQAEEGPVAAVSADPVEAAPREEEEPSFFTGFLKALTGLSRREREGLIDGGASEETDEAAAATEEAAVGSDGEIAAAPGGAATLDPTAEETADGAYAVEVEPDGYASPTNEPAAPQEAIAGRPPAEGEAPANDEPAAVEMAALLLLEPEAALEPENSVLGVDAEPLDPDLDKPATTFEAVVPLTADELDAAAEDADAVQKQEGPTFLGAFLKVLMGPNRREPEGRAEAESTDGGDDGDAEVAASLVDQGPSDAVAAAVETAALGPKLGNVEDEGPAAPPVEEDDLAGLALEALRGEAQAVDEIGGAIDEGSLDEAAAAGELTPGEPAIDSNEPGAAEATPKLAAVTVGEGSGDPNDVGPPVDGARTTEGEDAEAGVDTEALVAVAVTGVEEAEATGAKSRIDWREADEPSMAAVEQTAAPESGPPVEVAARGDSDAALSVVATALGAAADLDGLSDAERLSAGLAAYLGRDYAGAVTAWLPLAERGDRMAQFYVGGLYLDGTGLPPSRVWAHVFWTLAAEQGQETASGFLAVLTADMLPVERAEARDLATAWRPRR